MVRIPEDIRELVVTRVYRDAIDAGWSSLPQANKGRLYDQWASDPRVGGLLRGYVPPDRVRLWIKDGPMKAFSQATAGVGPYAKYAPTLSATPDRAVAAALGRGWTADHSTVNSKPLRVVAVSEADGTARRVVYGSARKFKDLLWAALLDSDTDQLPVTILVLEDAGAVPTVERDLHQRLSARCEVQVTWASL